MRLGPGGTRALKTVHLFAVVLWMGGLVTWLPLIHGMAGTTPGTTEMYQHLRAIALNVIGWGGIFSFVTGVALGLLSSWGLLRQLWTAAKLILTLCCIPFGMFVIERTMLEGLTLAAAGRAVDANLASLKWMLAVQLVAFGSMVALAVFKPRRLERAPAGAIPDRVGS